MLIELQKVFHNQLFFSVVIALYQAVIIWHHVAAGGADKLATLSPEAMAEVVRYASVESFQVIAYVPLLLLPVFGSIWLYDRRNGGVHR